MPPFSPLRIEKVPGESNGRQLFRLIEPLDFRLGLNGASVAVTVPQLYVTDFASVPRWLWPIFPPAGPWCEASVVHDYLCGVPDCTRFLADAIFREAMYHLGVPVWRRVLIFYGVRVYGVLLWFLGRSK